MSSSLRHLDRMFLFNTGIIVISTSLNNQLFFFYHKDKCIESIREVSKMVHRHPDQAPIWLNLTSLMVRFKKPAVKCAQMAMKLGQNDMDVTKVKKEPCIHGVEIICRWISNFFKK